MMDMSSKNNPGPKVVGHLYGFPQPPVEPSKQESMYEGGDKTTKALVAPWNKEATAHPPGSGTDGKGGY